MHSLAGNGPPGASGLPQDGELSCPDCGAVYPVRDGIPDLVAKDRCQGTFLEAESDRWDQYTQEYDRQRTRDLVYLAAVEAEVEA